MSSAQAVANVGSEPIKRRQRSVSERRRIVEQMLAPGASAKAVAEANGVRPNQLFKWRQQYRKGRLGKITPETQLLPVRIVASTDVSKEAVIEDDVDQPRGRISIELANARLLIEGVVDSAALRTVLECLAQ